MNDDICCRGCKIESAQRKAAEKQRDDLLAELRYARKAFCNAMELGIIPTNHHEETRRIVARMTVALVKAGDPEAI